LQREARFSELAHTIDGISERMLSERLRELEEGGIVERSVDAGPPVRVTYALTASGRALEPAMTALRAWAEQQSH
jgi:DNA-binding HxlR family transcriptional regulator